MKQDPNKMTLEELLKAQEEGHSVVIAKGKTSWYEEDSREI